MVDSSDLQRFQSYRDEIKGIEEQIKTLKAQITDTKRRAREDAKSLLNNHDNEQMLWLASAFYWLFDDLIDAQMICNHLGISAQQVKDVLREVTITICLTCVDCQQEVEYTPTSRTDAQYRLRHRTCVCPDCEERRKERREDSAIAHRQRIEYLQSLPYSEYLKTDHWQQLRTRMLRYAKYRCQLCNKQATLHVHHRTYENLGNEEYKDLIVLCAHCHAKFHDKLKENPDEQ